MDNFPHATTPILSNLLEITNDGRLSRRLYTRSRHCRRNCCRLCCFQCPYSSNS